MPPSRSKRGVGYSQIEVDSLLDLLEEHLPVCNAEWRQIADLHKCNFPAKDCSVDSLKRKYQDLYRVKMPSGDPFMPADVRRAKEIQKRREEKINSSDCEGGDDDDNNEPVPTLDSNTNVDAVENASVASARPAPRTPRLLSTRKRKSYDDDMGGL